MPKGPDHLLWFPTNIGYGSLNVILNITIPFSRRKFDLTMLIILIDWIMGADDHPHRKGWLMAGQK